LRLLEQIVVALRSLTTCVPTGNEVIAVDWKGLKDVDQINMDSTSSLHGSSFHRPSNEVSACPRPTYPGGSESFSSFWVQKWVLCITGASSGRGPECWCVPTDQTFIAVQFGLHWIELSHLLHNIHSE